MTVLLASPALVSSTLTCPLSLLEDSMERLKPMGQARWLGKMGVRCHHSSQAPLLLELGLFVSQESCPQIGVNLRALKTTIKTVPLTYGIFFKVRSVEQDMNQYLGTRQEFL
jgi:hypothetical protein